MVADKKASSRDREPSVASEVTPVRVFLSYRRTDSRHATGRLRARLAEEFGRDNVFYDVDSVAFGDDFRKQISQTLRGVDALVLVIGPGFDVARLGQSDRLCPGRGPRSVQPGQADRARPRRRRLDAQTGSVAAGAGDLCPTATLRRFGPIPTSISMPNGSCATCVVVSSSAGHTPAAGGFDGGPPPGTVVASPWADPAAAPGDRCGARGHRCPRRRRRGGPRTDRRRPGVATVHHVHSDDSFPPGRRRRQRPPRCPTIAAPTSTSGKRPGPPP